MRDEEDGGRERLLVHLLARSGAEGDGEVPAASGDSTSRRRRRRNRRTVTAERERRASSLLVSRRLGWVGLGWAASPLLVGPHPPGAGGRGTATGRLQPAGSRHTPGTGGHTNLELAVDPIRGCARR
jgi:hypothetical protein